MAVEKTIKIPDIGSATAVDVIEILVKVGDTIAIDTPLVTLESDKASMEIPASDAGVVQAISVKIGDKVAEGDVILTLATAAAEPAVPEQPPTTAPENAAPKAIETKAAPSSEPIPVAVSSAQEPPVAPTPTLGAVAESSAEMVYAGPAVRRFAHALGVDLHLVPGSGSKARIVKEDVEQYVKQRLTAPQGTPNLLAPAPSIDFTKFGEISSKPLNKIKRLTGINVQRAWVTIPHVTQFDEADITDLEAFRKTVMPTQQDVPVKLTILAFVCKVVSQALQVFPQFNTSLDASGEHLIYKHYCNIGIAVETINGLVVPVIKDVDRLSVTAIAAEMARLSSKARDKGLMPADMSGGCFTISSLGGIGGTAFTPIVNSPEVAILGLSKATLKPVYCDGAFVARLLLPLSLSYDHRVIDGAEAARFSNFLRENLSDIRRVLL